MTAESQPVPSTTSIEINSTPADDWSLHYAALLKYYDEHGTCNVPQATVYECKLPGMGKNGRTYHFKGKLGHWVRNQRQIKKGGSKKRKLTIEQKTKLQLLVDQGNS